MKARAPLTQVRCALSSRLETPPHVAALVSGFLDASQCISLVRAAASGSARLFERVAFQLGDNENDPVVRAFAFSLAFEAAIKADDVAMVQKVADLHLEPLQRQHLELALMYGSLDLVQWVLERLDLAQDQVALAAQCIGPKDTYRVMTWLIDRGLLPVDDVLSEPIVRALRQSVDFVKWYDTKGFLADTMLDRLVAEAINATNDASLEIVKYLFARGYSAPASLDDIVNVLIQASCRPHQEELVELVLASAMFDPIRHHFVYAATRPGGDKVLQWSRAYASTRGPSFASVVASSFSSGHLDTIKWVVERRGETRLNAPQGTVPHQHALALVQWFSTRGGDDMWFFGLTNWAAENGHLTVLQWLHEHHSDGFSIYTMDYAASCGHLDVVRWLDANRLEGCTEEALNGAASHGHLAVVRWFRGHRGEGNLSTALAHAAPNGHFEVVRWGVEHGGCAGCVQSHLLSRPSQLETINPSSRIPRRLYVLQWLGQHIDKHSGDCGHNCVAVPAEMFPSPNIAIHALCASDLPLLDYLFRHHNNLFTVGQGNTAMCTLNNLTAMQWLYGHFPSAFDWQQVAQAAHMMGKTAVVAWLRQVRDSTGSP